MPEMGQRGGGEEGERGRGQTFWQIVGCVQNCQNRGPAVNCRLLQYWMRGSILHYIDT